MKIDRLDTPGLVRGGLLTAAVGILLLTATGCAPQALGFQYDDTIRQGTPIARGHTAWGGVDLENNSGSPVVLKKLVLTGLINATISRLRVIKVTTGNGFGFYYPPVTAGMEAELSAAKPLTGYTIPAHSGDNYEAVFLLSVADPTRDATTTAAEVTYESGWATWTETRHSAFCMYARAGRGCDR
jgi:hypothetical protein